MFLKAYRPKGEQNLVPVLLALFISNYWNIYHNKMFAGHLMMIVVGDDYDDNDDDDILLTHLSQLLQRGKASFLHHFCDSTEGMLLFSTSSQSRVC